MVYRMVMICVRERSYGIQDRCDFCARERSCGIQGGYDLC